MYDRSYFSAGGGWVCGYWDGSYESNEQNLRAEARQALADIPATCGRLLEIGCAGGFFLDEARKAGFDVTGAELNKEMVEHARGKLGLTVHHGMFEKAGLELHSFDIVVAQDVLEHVRNPHTFVASAASLLTSQGYLFIRGPLEDCTKEKVYILARQCTGNGSLLVNEPPFHLQGFNAQSFARVLRAGGLEALSFDAGMAPPPWKFRGLKQTASTLIEQTAFYFDKVRGGGDFMTASARMSN